MIISESLAWVPIVVLSVWQGVAYTTLIYLAGLQTIDTDIYEAAAHFTRLDQYRDLESLNAYHQRVEEAKVQSAESMMAGIAARGRDNARTPMQWDGSAYAGFTAPDAAVEPWISVNRNHTQINAAGEFDDPDSVYTFYKRLIAIRHENALVAAGD